VRARGRGGEKMDEKEGKEGREGDG